MILPYQDIILWAESGGIDPFDRKLVNPASIDLRWSGRFRIAQKTGPRWSETMHAESLSIRRGDLYLLDTMERITMPPDCVGLIMLKSSSGRMGLEHLHAGLFDPDFPGTATLEVENRHPQPLTIERGQRLVQLLIAQMKDKPDVSYLQVGRYVGQSEPTPTRAI